MNATDIIIVLIVIALLGLANWFYRKNGHCSDCHSCNRTCHKKPSFVEAYRKDHPKQS